MPDKSLILKLFLLTTTNLYHPDPEKIWIIELTNLCVVLLMNGELNVATSS